MGSRGMSSGRVVRQVGPVTSTEAVGDPVRLAAVRETGLLDSTAVEALDQLTELAATLLQAPLAFLTLVDDRRSHWVSCIGVGGSSRHTTVQESFCQYVIEDAAPLVVADATTHPRTRDNPLVRTMGVRAWAGFPLLDPAGNALGSFCVVDTEPREWDDEQVHVLQVLASAASAQVALLAQVRREQDARHDAQRLRVAEDGLARMSVVALELTSVETVAELADIIIDRGLPALGADGGAVLVRERAGDGSSGQEEDELVRLVVGRSLGETVQSIYHELPLDSPLPAVYTARTGHRLTLPTRKAGLAFTPQMAQVYDDTQRLGWVFCPMRVGDRLLGSLSASWVDEHECTVEQLALLDGFAAQCAQALDRIQRQQEEQVSADAAKQMSEALQRGLLTKPATPERLSIAVRYEPASQQAQIGGDWYDAFVTAAGSTMLVIGDVSGHDRLAAAAMGQVRNLVRGMAYDSEDSPAILLGRLDAAFRGLQLDTLATAVLARVEQSPADRNRGVHRLRWSNAGHLPPMLREPDGTVRVLTGRMPDLLLGVDPTADRTERVAELVDGATVLFYTDGLVERRGTAIDDSITMLADLLAEVGGTPEQVCDELLARFGDGGYEDDVALLVMRVQPA